MPCKARSALELEDRGWDASEKGVNGRRWGAGHGTRWVPYSLCIARKGILYRGEELRGEKNLSLLHRFAVSKHTR